jgi:F-type H+-transporting ATPase subunit b
LGTVCLLGAAVPEALFAAEGGIHHAESWELARDGARILNFLIVGGIVFYLLKRFAWPLVVARAEGIRTLIRDMEKARADAKAQLADFEDRTKCLKEEAEIIREDAKKEAEFLKEEILQAAQKEAEEVLKRAREQIELESNQKKWELQKYAADLAIEMAEEILAQKVVPENHRKFVKEYLAKMERTK